MVRKDNYSPWHELFLNLFHACHNHFILQEHIFTGHNPPSILYTVFPHIVSVETILFWLWPYVLWPLITVHKCAESIQGRKLFKGGNYKRKYGIWECTELVNLNALQSIVVLRASDYLVLFRAEIGFRTLSMVQTVALKKCWHGRGRGENVWIKTDNVNYGWPPWQNLQSYYVLL